jgi:hypothetical protein
MVKMYDRNIQYRIKEFMCCVCVDSVTSDWITQRECVARIHCNVRWIFFYFCKAIIQRDFSVVYRYQKYVRPVTTEWGTYPLTAFFLKMQLGRRTYLMLSYGTSYMHLMRANIFLFSCYAPNNVFVRYLQLYNSPVSTQYYSLSLCGTSL